jgi:ubiquitin C-terminal hydrolase
MNPLFKGIQANDTKDLILFILETIHNELNEINNSINGNNNFANPLDYNSVFVNFSIFFRKNYNSIISNLFYGMNNSMMTCCTCQRTIHNVQCFNILIFPLEEVRKYKGYNQNIVSLNDCFDYNEKQEYMFGENQISCNYCNRMSNSLNQTKIIISPNVLIINLNRGRGLMYDIKLYFSEYIDIKKYIFYSASPHYYELVGVVSHLGSSDMSGHFIAFCKNSENCKWYKFNDAIVTESNIQEVLNFGVPYVLFYNYVKS